jgi:hypothetical protein
LSVVLLATSLSKAYTAAAGLTIEPFFFTSRPFLGSLAAGEAVFAIWLLYTSRLHLARQLAIVCFTVFTGVALMQGIGGQPSCHCLGDVVPVTPWQAVAFDVAALLALVSSRPAEQSIRTENRFRQFLPYFAGGLVLLTILGGWSLIRFGSVALGLAYLRGEKLAVVPRYVNLGDGFPGEVRAITVQLVNLSDHVVILVGTRPRCGCKVLADLPLTLAPHGSCSFCVLIEFTVVPGDGPEFTREVLLYTAQKGQPFLAFWTSGRVVESAIVKGG